jgi:hypothetical protein
MTMACGVFCLRQPLDVKPKHRKGDPEADHNDE